MDTDHVNDRLDLVALPGWEIPTMPGRHIWSGQSCRSNIMLSLGSPWAWMVFRH